MAIPFLYTSPYSEIGGEEFESAKQNLTVIQSFSFCEQSFFKLGNSLDKGNCFRCKLFVRVCWEVLFAEFISNSTVRLVKVTFEVVFNTWSKILVPPESKSVAHNTVPLS